MKWKSYLTGFFRELSRPVILLILISCLTFEIFAGDTGHVRINGILRDSSTGSPVAFASVYMAHSNIGTVTNPDGEYSILIPLQHGGFNIVFSHIGYGRTSLSVSEIIDGGGVIYITPVFLPIPEVVVKPVDARAIIAAALGRVNENYPVVPCRLTGFYRETIRQGRDYISISEAVVDIYQSPYNLTGESDMIRIIKGRKSSNAKKMDTLLVKLQGGPHVSMLLDIVKNADLLISEETIDWYSFELDGHVVIDESVSYVINFTPRRVLNYPLYHGKLYISADRLAIIKAEFSLDLSDRDKAAQSFILKKPARLRFNPVGSKYIVSYIEVGGRYHVNYLRYELEFLADWRRRLFQTGYTIMSEMAITSRDYENATRFDKKEAMGFSVVMAELVPLYFDQEYWAEYNYIEPDHSVETAIKRLNRRLSW